uniref:Uncharacterized protein n=1 Tax=Lymantria dispar multicapsid nuclear polyhedrosis virus TaxID=10449 RepID=A0A1B1MQZ1_NPVLD|nr:hypothetical protein [Lymantria dispar multiple nucleopolyhedrovirus]
MDNKRRSASEAPPRQTKNLKRTPFLSNVTKKLKKGSDTTKTTTATAAAAAGKIDTAIDESSSDRRLTTDSIYPDNVGQNATPYINVASPHYNYSNMDIDELTSAAQYPSALLGPQNYDVRDYYYDLEDDAGDDTTNATTVVAAEVLPINVTVRYVRGPLLSPSSASVNGIQLNINKLKQYLNLLTGRSNVTLKEYARASRSYSDTSLDYMVYVHKLAFEKNVNNDHVKLFANMLYAYYYELIENTRVFAEILVNVMYSRKRTSISRVVVSFVNMMVDYMVRLLFDRLGAAAGADAATATTATIDNNLVAQFKRLNRKLYHLLNAHLIDCQQGEFYKFTSDNDISTAAPTANITNQNPKIAEVNIEVVQMNVKLYY